MARWVTRRQPALPHCAIVKPEPENPSRDLLTAALADRWGIAGEIVHLPVGGGGNHWRVGGTSPWFVTASGLAGRSHWLESTTDDLYRRTEAAFEAARDLRFPFVLSAVPDRDGLLLHRIHPDWGISVYPYLDPATDDDAHTGLQLRQTLARCLGRLHAASPPPRLPRWRLEIPKRQHLHDALDGRISWTGTPYAEQVPSLLTSHDRRLREQLARYDTLAIDLTAKRDPWVVTHGEPEPRNTLRTADGMTYLIDWDTIAYAPRERDLWNLGPDPDGSVRAAYVEGSGHDRPAHVGGLELFGLWWWLSDIGCYLRQLRGEHSPGPADAAALTALEQHLQ